MSVKFTPDHTRTSEYRFFPEDIIIKSALNGRHELPDIEWLVKDIVANGQHTPVPVRIDGGKPVLCAGFSRYRAVSEINKRGLLGEKIRLRCTYVQCSEEEGFVKAISENRMRNATTPLDDAYNIKRLAKVYQKTDEEIALVYFPGSKDEQLKEAIRWVKKASMLVNLTPEAEKAFRDGRIKGSAAQALAKLSEEQQREAVAAAKDGKVKAPKKDKGPKKPKDGEIIISPVIKDALNAYRSMNNHGLIDQEALEELCAEWLNKPWEEGSDVSNAKRAKQLGFIDAKAAGA